MGLDMFLSAEFYVSGYGFDDRHEKGKFDKIVDVLDVAEAAKRVDAPSMTITVTVGYWRKANQIHQWMVENCQDGKDECQKSYVSRDKLEELRDLCQRVLNTIETVEGDVHNGTTYNSGGEMIKHFEPGRIVCQKKIAEDLLPTATGFFFGSVDYDEYYIQDLEETVKLLDGVLADEKLVECDFYYQASW